MSGRPLRRLPVLAHARYIGSMSMQVPLLFGHKLANGGKAGTTIDKWLDAMERVVENQKEQRGRLDGQAA